MPRTSYSNRSAVTGNLQVEDSLELLARTALEFKEMPAPGTPRSGALVAYAKADGKLYAKDDAGTEYDLTVSDAYAPAVPDDWEDVDPTTKTGALDRMAGGHAGVVLVSATPPATPAIGQIRLDKTASGASGLGKLTTNTITGDLTLTTSHTEVGCDTTSGPITVTLPDAANHAGRMYLISNIAGTGNAVTIDGDGALINGSSTKVLASQYNAVILVCDGTGWRIY